ncbi:MAG: hypothetical protein KC413_12620, partial [Anaerolineales bacterium]|nr:hypothetical protein [Anaerolineales bacterium]
MLRLIISGHSASEPNFRIANKYKIPPAKQIIRVTSKFCSPVLVVHIESGNIKKFYTSPSRH